MEDLTIKFRETLEKYRELQKVREYHISLVERLKAENADLENLEKKLHKEERDVKRLEGSGVTSLFHKVLGDREKQLEKERQEYLHVALKYNELVKSVELIQYEMGVLEKKVGELPEVEQRYMQLLKSREQQLRSLGGEAGQRLSDIQNEIDRRHVLLKDIDEALATGREAYKHVFSIEKRLKEARDWGQWDMYGGEKSHGWMKHHAIDRAREVLHKARHSLIKFDTELRDVFADKYLNIDIGIGDIDRFLDVFLDNLITDWIVQQKIKKALDRVKRVRREVETTLKRLEQEVPVVEIEIEDLEQRRERVIIDSST